MTPIETALRSQAEWCRRLGSDLYGRLLDVAAADFGSGGPVARLLGGWQGHPVRQALALRMMGGVHHQVLSGSAPSLAAHYPSAGGAASWPNAGSAFLDVIAARSEEISPWLERGVQTNEVNRSAVLLGGLLEVAGRTRLPVRLLEIGASAGLNLLPDRYHYDLGGHTWGDTASPVRLVSEWTGSLPDLAAPLHVTARGGCDPSPIDPADPVAAARLRAFVWPDQARRLARLTAAIALAARVAPRIEADRAVHWLPGVLSNARPGTATVVMHSVVWHYIDRAEQAEITALIERAGATANHDTPLAWLHVENLSDEGMDVRLRMWPGGEETVLGVAHAHGATVEWRL